MFADQNYYIITQEEGELCLEEILGSKFWTSKYIRSLMGRKCQHMLDWTILSKDTEQILISDECNENESNNKDGENDSESDTF